ncbi:unnamed protein product [Ostreobium quekettii]|uniref:Uncharacterized protein n=1 Tax=Ostreobium quekettii TaxID=121088 RepID=A0A8S1IWI5_9CHLO|nr:unnamed protein product [Ostreobium quekettii]
MSGAPSEEPRKGAVGCVGPSRAPKVQQHRSQETRANAVFPNPTPGSAQRCESGCQCRPGSDIHDPCWLPYTLDLRPLLDQACRNQGKGSHRQDQCFYKGTGQFAGMTAATGNSRKRA